MTALIEAEGLAKSFGKLRAVDGITLNVARGEVLGFLGPNGAGKSTTMRLITGFLEPDAGRARIAGFDVQDHPKEARKRLGYLPEGAPLYAEMTPKGLLSFVAELQGLAGRCDRQGGGAGGREDRPRSGARADDRNAVQGLQAPRGHRPGHAQRSRGADHGRAHRRARSQPEASGAPAHHGDGQGKGHHRLHAHPRRGRGRVHARGRDQQGPHRRRRHRRGSDAQGALSRCGRRCASLPTKPKP